MSAVAATFTRGVFRATRVKSKEERWKQRADKNSNKMRNEQDYKDVEWKCSYDKKINLRKSVTMI